MPEETPDETAAALLARRYGAAPAFAAHANPVIAHLLSHRSVRAYEARPLGEGVIETIVAAGQSASTSSNLQTWSVVAVEDPERKAALGALTGNPALVTSAPCVLMWIADLARLQASAADRGIAIEGTDYLEVFLVACIDAALAAQNSAVAAEALGLGISYVGAMRNKPLDVARILALPPRTFAVFGMCLGHPDPTAPAAIKPRLPQSVVLHRETYSSVPRADGVTAYNGTMDAFYRAEGMASEPWSVRSGNRVRGPESLHGRHLLKDVLNRLGFALK